MPASLPAGELTSCAVEGALVVVATSRNQLLAFSGGKAVATYKAHTAGSAISKVHMRSLALPAGGACRSAGNSAMLPTQLALDLD